jgi:conjugative transfer signal peptidase TraF
MNRLLKKVAVAVAGAGAGVIALGMICYVIGARINTSRSIPLGLYWTSGAPVEKGAYVMFCPPSTAVFYEAKKRGYLAAGFCAGDFGYVMKRVLGVANDAVKLTDGGVLVNQHLLAFSAPRPSDFFGRPLPRYEPRSFNLTESQLLLMSDVSETSFDARYFGPVDRAQIRSVIVPVLTW